MTQRSTFLAAIAGAGAAVSLARPALAQAVTLTLAAPFADSFGTPFYIKDAGALRRAASMSRSPSFRPAPPSSRRSPATGSSSVADLCRPRKRSAKAYRLRSSRRAGSTWRATHSLRSTSPRTRRSGNRATSKIARSAYRSSPASPRPPCVAWLTNKGRRREGQVRRNSSPSAPAAILRGTIDASVLGEPFITPVKNQIRDIGHPLDAIAREYPVSAWFAARSWLEADRPRAKRAVDAIFETSRWANAHRPETLAILARDGKMDINEIRTMVRTLYGTSLDLGQIQAVLNAAERFKFVDKALDANSIIYRP